MKSVQLTGREKPVPGCLGRMENLFDLTSAVADNRILTEKPHFANGLCFTRPGKAARDHGSSSWYRLLERRGVEATYPGLVVHQPIPKSPTSDVLGCQYDRGQDPSSSPGCPSDRDRTECSP